MAIYYVSPYGSDSNNGLGPDPTAAANKPFATLAKAIGASGIAVAGDTVYIAPGVYRGNTAVGVSGSSGSPISVLGDPANAQGFKDGSGVLLTAGEVRVTSYTTNDTTLPTTGQVLSANNKGYLNFANIWFIGYTTPGSSSVIFNGGSHDYSFTNCCFTQGHYTTASVVALSNSATQNAINATFDRCLFFGTSGDLINVTLYTVTTAEYNANITVTNSLFLAGGSQFRCQSTGANSFYGGGATIQNCTFFASVSSTVYVGSSSISTVYPVIVTNSILVRSGNIFNANVAGQIVEDYNYVFGTRTNTTAGTHSTSDGSQCLMLDMGQSMLWGQMIRPFLTPTIGSPQLGFSSATGVPRYDFLNRARPEGGKSLSNAAGYLERHDTAVQETTITDSGGVSIRIDGPGSHEFLIPVDATATTISVKCQYDTNHGTATPPQVVLKAAPEIGVGSQTVTAPATANAWSTLTLATITPTARGVVRVLVAARPSAANGKAYFDTFAVS